MGEENAGIAFNPSGYPLMAYTTARMEENAGHSGVSINDADLVVLLGLSTRKQLSVPLRLLTYDA